jgi:hypothetical protein
MRDITLIKVMRCAQNGIYMMLIGALKLSVVELTITMDSTSSQSFAYIGHKDIPFSKGSIEFPFIIAYERITSESIVREN